MALGNGFAPCANPLGNLFAQRFAVLSTALLRWAHAGDDRQRSRF
jgi:hypothetical protein